MTLIPVSLSMVIRRNQCSQLSNKLLFRRTHSSQYIFSLLLSVVNNRGCFFSNNKYHNINTRQKNDLHLPQVSRTIYQKGVHYSGIQIFNGLPWAIKDISSEPKKFKVSLKHYLPTHSFYSLDEFFSIQII